MITKTAERLVSYNLLKEAAARWKMEWSGLSGKSRGRLINNGVVNPWQREVAGLNRGTENILKRYGAKHVPVSKDMGVAFDGKFHRAEDILREHGDYVSLPSTRGPEVDTVYTPKPGTMRRVYSTDNPGSPRVDERSILMDNAISRRHEAYEVSEASRILNANRKRTGKSSAVRHIPVQDDPRTASYVDSEFSHASPAVLALELQTINRNPNAHILSKSLQNIRSMRMENALLHKARTGDRTFYRNTDEFLNSQAARDSGLRAVASGSHADIMSREVLNALYRNMPDKRMAQGIIAGDNLYHRRMTNRDYRKMRNNWKLTDESEGRDASGRNIIARYMLPK